MTKFPGIAEIMRNAADIRALTLDDLRGRSDYPANARAQCVVTYARKLGVLTPQPCACGVTKTDAHHTDYSKPLDVTWLCRRCHRREHARLRKAA